MQDQCTLRVNGTGIGEIEEHAIGLRWLRLLVAITRDSLLRPHIQLLIIIIFRATKNIGKFEGAIKVVFID